MALIFAKLFSAGKMTRYFQISGGRELGSCCIEELHLTEYKLCLGLFKHGFCKSMGAVPNVNNEKLQRRI